MSSKQEKTPDSRTEAIERVAEYLRQHDRLRDHGGLVHTAHADPDAEAAALTAADLQQVLAAARTMEGIAAFMGTRNKWGYEIGEDVADIIFEAGYPHPANPDNRAHYEAIADALGMDFEEAEEEFE